MDEKNTLASEILEMLKGQLKFYKILVVVLVLLLAAIWKSISPPEDITTARSIVSL